MSLVIPLGAVSISLKGTGRNGEAKYGFDLYQIRIITWRRNFATNEERFFLHGIKKVITSNGNEL